MEPWHVALLAIAGVVLALGVRRAKAAKPLVFDDAALARVKSAIAAHGFTIESYDHAPGGGVRALGVHLNERVVGSVACATKANGGVTTSIVVHGMTTPAAVVRVARDRKGLAKGTEVTTGDAAFDDKLKVDGAPDDAVRTMLTQPLRNALGALFAIDGVRELRVLALGDQGGAVRIEMSGTESLRPVAQQACIIADAIEDRGSNA